MVDIVKKRRANVKNRVKKKISITRASPESANKAGYTAEAPKSEKRRNPDLHPSLRRLLDTSSWILPGLDDEDEDEDEDDTMEEEETIDEAAEEEAEPETEVIEGLKKTKIGYKNGEIGKGRDDGKTEKGKIGKKKDDSKTEKGKIGKGKDGNKTEKGKIEKGKDDSKTEKGKIGKGKDDGKTDKGKIGKGKDDGKTKKGKIANEKDGSKTEKGKIGKGKFDGKTEMELGKKKSGEITFGGKKIGKKLEKHRVKNNLEEKNISRWKK